MKYANGNAITASAIVTSAAIVIVRTRDAAVDLVVPERLVVDGRPVVDELARERVDRPERRDEERDERGDVDREERDRRRREDAQRP